MYYWVNKDSETNSKTKNLPVI